MRFESGFVTLVCITNQVERLILLSFECFLKIHILDENIPNLYVIQCILILPSLHLRHMTLLVLPHWMTEAI